MPVHTERLLSHVRNLVPRSGTAIDSDAEMLARFVRYRDEGAFTILVSRHGPMVLGVCRRVLGDVNQAEDAAQATFLVLARRARTIRRPETLAAWLYQTARNLALKHQRAEIRRQRRETRTCLSSAATLPSGPLDELLSREHQAIFDEELRQLPEHHRLPLILCCLEGCTLQEASRQLGWTVGSVKGRLERARAALQNRLVQRGLGLSAVLVGLEQASATLPSAFLSTTVRAALQFSLSSGASEVGVPVQVANLAQQGLRGPFLFGVKLALSVLLVVGAVTAGVAFVGHRKPSPGGKSPGRKAPGRPASRPQPHTDLHGDPLPAGALARLGTLRWRTDGEIQDLVVSPDGKKVACTTGRGISLFDEQGRAIKHIRPGKTSFHRVAFAPDGKRLACWCTMSVGRRVRQAVQVWELPGARKAKEYPLEVAVKWLGWSKEGSLQVVVLGKGKLGFRDLTKGTQQSVPVKEVPERFSGYVDSTYAPEPRWYAMAEWDKPRIHVWDLVRGNKHKVVEFKGSCRDLALSPDGRSLALIVHEGPKKRVVQVWDLTTGKIRHRWTTDQTVLSAVEFSPDGKQLATVGWRDIRLWDVASGRARSHLRGVHSLTFRVAFAADGKTLIAPARHSGTMYRWDVATGARKPTPTGHTNRLTEISFSPDGQRAVTGDELGGTLLVWDLETARPLTHIQRKNWVRDCYFSRDGRTLYTCWTGDQVVYFDSKTGREQARIPLKDPDRPDSKQSGLHMHLSADGKRLVAFSVSRSTKEGDNREELLATGWETATGKQLFRRRLQLFSWFAVSSDLRLLALFPEDSPGDKGIEQLHPLGRALRIEELATGTPYVDMPPVKGQSSPITFSPDNRLLVAKCYHAGQPPEKRHSLQLWEVASGILVRTFPSVFDARAAFSTDGRLLAFAVPSQQIAIWDLRQGKEVQRLADGGADISKLAFSPDGTRLLSGHTDSTVLVWRVVERQPGKPIPLSAKELAKAWADLAGEPAKAFVARGMLARAPAQALPLCKKHLKPVKPAEPRRIRRLLAELDSKQFAKRKKAQKELEALGDRARGGLREALKGKPSLEMHRRVQALLRRLRPPVTHPETLRALRAIAVLEDIGNEGARELLKLLATGAKEARQTWAAQASLGRLHRRVAKTRRMVED